MERIKAAITKNIVFIIEFIFFSILLMMIPCVCDRWMENSLIPTLEDPIRYIFYQLKWIRIANARVFSNLFAGIIQLNFYFCAIVNALIITFVSIYMIKLLHNEKNNLFLSLLSFMGMLIVPWGIYQEVYYYACTLYMGAVLILIMLLYYSNNSDEKSKKIVYILVIIGCLWLETLSCCIVAIFTIIIINDIRTKKKVKRRDIVCIGIDIIGLLIMIRSSSRISLIETANIPNRRVVVQNSFLNFWNIVYSNKFILLWFFIVVVCIIYMQKKMISRFLFSLQMLLWGVGTVILMIWNCNTVYKIISIDPQDKSYSHMIDYTSKKSYLFEKLFYSIAPEKFANCPVISLIIIAFFGISIIYIIFKFFKMRLLNFSILVLIVAGSVLGVFGIEIGARVLSTSSFLLVFLCIEGVSYLIKSEKECNIVRHIVIVIILYEIMGNLLFARVQYDVEKNRVERASEVRYLQETNQWNYTNAVFMPSYRPDSLGKELMGEERKNPSNDDLYYQFFLKHYGLDRRTKVLFD